MIFILTGIVFLGLYSKANLHLLQNSWHAPWADGFFFYLTHAGDGWAFLPAFVLLLFIGQRREALGLILVALLTLFTSAGLKNLFREEPRPTKYFAGKTDLHLVEGVRQHSFRSFPSGHTMTGFSCYGYLALCLRLPLGHFLLALLAIGVAYSRVYLSQHFLRDVIAGALLGSAIALIGAYLAQAWRSKWAQKGIFSPLNKP